MAVYRKRVIVLSKTLKEARMETELFCGPLIRLASMFHSDGAIQAWVLRQCGIVLEDVYLKNNSQSFG